jgi:hypothetical protein
MNLCAIAPFFFGFGQDFIAAFPRAALHKRHRVQACLGRSAPGGGTFCALVEPDLSRPVLARL